MFKQFFFVSIKPNLFSLNFDDLSMEGGKKRGRKREKKRERERETEEIDK